MIGRSAILRGAINLNGAIMRSNFVKQKRYMGANSWHGTTIICVKKDGKVVSYIVFSGLISKSND